MPVAPIARRGSPGQGNIRAAMTITDFHTHAFPDPLAERAIRTLEAETVAVQARLDGKLSSLLASMDSAGIGRCVVCSIATRPEQFDPIMRWSRQIRSARVFPFPSVHPRDGHVPQRVACIAEAGFAGIKMHPYYQDFVLDDPLLDPLYEAVVSADLMLVMHTGFDIAFPRIRRCDPRRILNVIRRFPNLKLVATHLGAWDDWEEVRRHVLGREILIEISYSLECLPPNAARQMLLRHPEDYLLFGTDSPWQDQAEALALLRSMDLGAARERKILCANAERLLGIGSPGLQDDLATG